MKRYIREALTAYVKDKNRGLWRDPIAGFAAADKLEGLPAFAWVAVIYFIPFSRTVIDWNRIDGEVSRDWTEAREETRALIRETDEALAGEIKSLGYKAVPVEATEEMAYRGGLGAYGLHGRIITSKGSAGMFGALASNLMVEADRPMREELCLYRSRGICATCMKNCAAGAISPAGFDEKVCREYVRTLRGYPESTCRDTCGKCISFSPCAYRKG